MSVYVQDMLANMAVSPKSKSSDIIVLLALIVSMIVLAFCICKMYNVATAQYSPTEVSADALKDAQTLVDKTTSTLASAQSNYIAEYNVLVGTFNTIPTTISVAQVAIASAYTAVTQLTGNVGVAATCYSKTAICIDNLWSVLTTLKPFYDAAQDARINRLYKSYDIFTAISPNLIAIGNNIDAATDAAITTPSTVCPSPDISGYTTLKTYSAVLTTLSSATTPATIYYTITLIYNYFNTCYTGLQPYVKTLQLDAQALNTEAASSIAPILSKYTKDTTPTLSVVTGYRNSFAGFADSVAALMNAMTNINARVIDFANAISSVVGGYTALVDARDKLAALSTPANIDITTVTASYNNCINYYKNTLMVADTAITPSSAVRNINTTANAMAIVNTPIMTSVITNISAYYMQLLAAYNYSVNLRVPWIICNIRQTDMECSVIIQFQSAISNITRIAQAILNNNSPSNLWDITKLSYPTGAHNIVMTNVYKGIIDTQQWGYDTYTRGNSYYGTTAAAAYKYIKPAQLYIAVRQFAVIGTTSTTLIANIISCEPAYIKWLTADAANTSAAGARDEVRKKFTTAVEDAQKSVTDCTSAKVSIVNTISVATLLAAIPYATYMVILLYRKSTDT